MKGILLCGHGSRSADALHDFETFVEKYKAQNQDVSVAYGFLELSKPTFADAVQSLYEHGFREIDALQLFLFSGKHISDDIPQQLHEIESQYSDLKISIHEPLGKDQRLVEIITSSVKPFLNKNKRQALLTVGVGASVEEANRQISELSSQLAKAVGISNLSVSFMSKVAKPNFEETISELVHTPVDEIIVVPLLLFNGVYYRSILNFTKEMQLKTSKQIVVLQTLASNQGFFDLLH